MTTIDLFESLLKDKMGLDPASIGIANVLRAVTARAKACTQGDIHAYWKEVVASPHEQQALIQAVVVPETWFFRYPESLVLVAKLAAARFAAFTSPSALLRIVSMPCSSGEEPYSIAMALLDAGLPPERFVIDAVDISEREIELARRGLYSNNSFRGTDLAYRDRHFTQISDRVFELSARVRAQVRLHCGNLLDPGLALTAAAYDLLFCRNLLIYFDLQTQEAGLRALLRLGHAGSNVFVGPAEASLLTRQGMRPMGQGGAFAFFMPRSEPIDTAPAQGRVVQPNQPAQLQRAQSVQRPMPAVRSGARPSQRPATPSAATAAGSREIKPAAVQAKNVDADFDRVIELADQGKVAAALELITGVLRQHGPSCQAFYLVGLCHDSQGDAANAQIFYRKALYLNPHHMQALVHLAALLEGQGDARAAERLRARATREAARS